MAFPTVVYTSNQAKITLSVPSIGFSDSTSWDKFTGGGNVAETQQHTPGGMGPSFAVGGIVKRNQITLERAWDDSLIGVYGDLDGAVNSPCTIGVQPLKSASQTIGKQRTYTGILREVSPPDTDASSSNVSMLQIVIEADEKLKT